MEKKTSSVIVDALRTPIGSFNGGLSSFPAHHLGAYVIKALLERTKLSPKEVCEVILGQVLTSACGQNPARQTLIHAGLPESVPGWTVNQVCGSGLKAVGLADQMIRAGDSRIVFAGGQETMSLAPHAVHMRQGTKMGDASLVDTMILDGLWDAFHDYHMGNTAENIAKKYGFSKEAQDTFACASQQKTEAAMKAGKFKEEIVPVTIKHRKGDVVVDTDEFPRQGVTEAMLNKLKPAFMKEGTVTAGNASGINDGAAIALVMAEEEACARKLTPLARIVSFAQAGVDPTIMGTGPIPAVQKALKKAGWKVSDLDLIEANEAFAAQAMSVNQELGFDLSKVNVNGGAIALGHPIGASGARCLVTLLYEMKRMSAKKGLVTLCIGGGMGVAMCVELV